jgi:hypothetical protein
MTPQGKPLYTIRRAEGSFAKTYKLGLSMTLSQAKPVKRIHRRLMARFDSGF